MKRKIVIFVIILIVAAAAYYFGSKIYKQHEFDKYAGHGFEYMGGYSSTDFKGYHVYDSDKLVKLDHKADFIIKNEKDMPVLDGAEACYPVYNAVALALYKDIDKIEKAAHIEEEKWWKSDTESDSEDKDWYGHNGKIVQFSNTVEGYSRLILGDVDIFIGARPSENQIKEAKKEKKEIVLTPVGSEAFVFFVEEDNPVDGLTSDQIRKIYHGDITNWKEVGGRDEKIVAFQRPEESGSQVMMKRFMGDVKMKKPDTVEMEDSMAGVISEVKQYNNEAGALGYTFKYFLTGLQQEKRVKILAVDGVKPTAENIASQKYPIVGPLVCAKIKGNKNPYVDKVIDFLRSEDGQEIVTKTGYGPIIK